MDVKDNIPATASPEMIMIPRGEYEALVTKIDQQGQMIRDFDVRFMSLQHQLELYKKMIFGSKSERFLSPTDKSQTSLDLGMVAPEVEEP